jgi:hypothetical protein
MAFSTSGLRIPDIQNKKQEEKGTLMDSYASGNPGLAGD